MNRKVLIKDKKHPWYGHTGELTNEELSNVPGMYVVKLDNGMKAGCYLNQLEYL